MSTCAAGLCTEDDRSAPAHDDSAWCTPTKVPVGTTVPLDSKVVTRTIMDGRTEGQTMAAGASVTWTHCSVHYEVTWG
jgi:hypothetical protein